MESMHVYRFENARRQPDVVDNSEACYYAALELVAHIDRELTRGTSHYRTKAGQLLETLDEVINAILQDDLQLPKNAQQQPRWVAPQELAA